MNDPDAHRESGKDRRTRAACRWHRQEHVGTFARSSGERRSVDLNGLIEEALNLAYHGARAQDASFNITLERDFGQGITPIELVPQGHHPRLSQLDRQRFLRAATKRRRREAIRGSSPT